jgi:hypothetical protein
MAKVPPLLGRKEAAEVLGMKPTNMDRDLGDELPRPLQERVEGMRVSQTPLWTVAEIEKLRDERAKP